MPPTLLERVANPSECSSATLEGASRDVISDEVWAVIGPVFPTAATGRPPVDRRLVVEATAWHYRTSAPWRDTPERFGNWNIVYKNFDRWSKAGVWAGVLEHAQSLAMANEDLNWVVSIDSTIVRVHQHGATLPRTRGLERTTGNSASNLLITRSAAPAAG